MFTAAPNCQDERSDLDARSQETGWRRYSTHVRWEYYSAIEREEVRTPLVVQWLRISLAMQRTCVQSPVRELKFHMPQSYWAYGPQQKIPRDVMKIPTAATKTWHNQINKHLSHKKNEICHFTATRMELETLKLSEVSQRENNKYLRISLTYGI